MLCFFIPFRSFVCFNSFSASLAQLWNRLHFIHFLLLIDNFRDYLAQFRRFESYFRMFDGVWRGVNVCIFFNYLNHIPETKRKKNGSPSLSWPFECSLWRFTMNLIIIPIQLF